MAGERNSYGKRQSDFNDNGGSKRRNPDEERDPFTPAPDDTLYRYLCPVRKTGSIIGRGGEIVKQLRADTQAKIRIGKSVPGCDERVIAILSTSKETNSFEDTGDKVCPAQDALFRVHERLTDKTSIDEEYDDGTAQISVRLLVPSDQVGCIIGKGGQIIQGLRSDTGAQIRIIKNETLPACASSTDELVQITGDVVVVKKALFQVSSRLHENPSRYQHLLSSDPPQIISLGGHFGSASSGTAVVGRIISSHGSYTGGSRAGDWQSFTPPSRDESSEKEFILRLICPSANIGGVIGKGGVTIKQIRHESRAFIKVDSSAAEDDCIITVSAKEFFENPVSPTIDALMHLQPRCSEKTEQESGEPLYTTRLLVPSSHIGCLIGKGGSIITEMRRSTRANIRILSKDNVPKVASEDDEMVQISAELDVARNALVQVATRLKANLFERESALSTVPPSVSYHPFLGNATGSKYGSRDDKLHGHGYYNPDGYGTSSDTHSSENYEIYGGSQGGGGSYGGYSGRSGSNGSALKPSLGRHRGH